MKLDIVCRWFVYGHYLKGKKKPFYIGIGCDKKRIKSKQGRNGKWKQVTGTSQWTARLLYNYLPQLDALKKERELIDLYKTIKDGGTLVNSQKGCHTMIDEKVYIFASNI